MRKIASLDIGALVSGSITPTDSKYATLPLRTIIVTAPGIVPLVISPLSHCVMRSSRSAERPTSAGFAIGRFCAASVARDAKTRTNERARAFTARIVFLPCGGGGLPGGGGHPRLRGMVDGRSQNQNREENLIKRQTRARGGYNFIGGA